MSSAVTVRIPHEMKKAIEKYRIEVSTITRNAIAEEIRRMRLKEGEEAAERLGETLSRMTDEEILQSIREDRERN